MEKGGLLTILSLFSRRMLRLVSLTSIVIFLFVGSVPRAAAQRYYQQVKEFGFPANSGADPFGDLCLAADGMLYGLLSSQGPHGPSILYRISTNGQGYEIVKRFDNEEAIPFSSFIQSSDGTFYGLGALAVFSIQTNGLGYRPISSDLPYFISKTHEGSDGYIYATTSHGGAHGRGLLFRVGKDGVGVAPETLRSFGSSESELPPIGGVIELPGGYLAGHTANAIYRIKHNGEGYEEIHRFTIGTNGYGPVGELAYSKAGRLWGLTEYGGFFAGGLIYSLNSDGSDFQVEHSFPNNTVDIPRFRLVEGSNGIMFGVVRLFNGSAIFRFDPRTKEYKQAELPKDENGELAYDMGGLIVAADGSLFGVAAGGANGDGILYACDPNLETPKVLREFSKLGGDGGSPVAFACGPDGNVYGLCQDGGKYNRGAIFSMAPDGGNYRVLHSFRNIGEGYPALVITGADGWLYGLIRDEGAMSQNHVFKLSKDGNQFSIIQTLLGRVVLSLWQAADGTLFGNARCSDQNTGDCNSMFALQPDGTGLRFFGPLPLDVRDHMGEFTPGSDGAFYLPIVKKIFRVMNTGEVTVIRQTEVVLSPYAMTETSDGYLYGGFINGFYRLKKDGSDYMHTSGGFDAKSRLLEVRPRVFYATGYFDANAIVRVNAAEGNVRAVQRFTDFDLGIPISGLQKGPNDLLFGITSGGGKLNAGTVFRYGPPTAQPELEIGLEQGRAAVRIRGTANALVRLQYSSFLFPNTWFDYGYTILPPEGARFYTPQSSPNTFIRAVLSGE
jgi:uncharacterized repeat protein (TIGR03803 family)